jgi:hypothetical protein
VNCWRRSQSLGNDASGEGAFVDTWASNLVVTRRTSRTNNTALRKSSKTGDFAFRAAAQGGPVTPFLVASTAITILSLLAVGRTRFAYEIGLNRFDFTGGIETSITVQPGESIAAGFVDTNAAGDFGDLAGVVAFNQGGRRGVCVPGASDSNDAPSLLAVWGLPAPRDRSSRRQSRLPLQCRTRRYRRATISVWGGGFEEAAPGSDQAPQGWVVSGEAPPASGLRGSPFSFSVRGQQIRILSQGNATLTSAVPVATVQPGTYEFTASLGNRNGGGPTSKLRTVRASGRLRSRRGGFPTRSTAHESMACRSHGQWIGPHTRLYLLRQSRGHRQRPAPAKSST